MAHDPALVAEGALDRLCDGDPQQTANNLAEFQHVFTMLALDRMRERLRSQPNDELSINGQRL